MKGRLSGPFFSEISKRKKEKKKKKKKERKPLTSLIWADN